MEKVLVAVVTTVLCSVFGAENQELEISGRQGEEVKETSCENDSVLNEMHSFSTAIDSDFLKVYEIPLRKN